MNTWLVAKRTVEAFTLSDEQGYELTFKLMPGSMIKVYDAQYAPFDSEDDEIYVHMYGPDDVYIVSNHDFDIERR